MRKGRRMKQVGSRSKKREAVSCDFCSSTITEEEVITVTSSGLLFLSCTECDLLNTEQDAHGQMSATDPLNHFFITPTNESEVSYE